MKFDYMRSDVNSFKIYCLCPYMKIFNRPTTTQPQFRVSGRSSCAYPHCGQPLVVQFVTTYGEPNTKTNCNPLLNRKQAQNVNCWHLVALEHGQNRTTSLFFQEKT